MPRTKQSTTTARDTVYLQQLIKTQLLLSQANFNLDAFMKLVVNQIQKITGGTGAVVELVEGKEMVYRAATGTVASHIGLRLAANTSISGLCIKKRKVLQSPDTEKDKRVNIIACRKVKARSLIVAPLFHEGKAVGVLKILSKKPRAFDARNVQTLQSMAALIGAALSHRILYDASQKLLTEKTKTLKELRKAQNRLQQLAHHDYLTNLYNRSVFNEILTKTLERVQRSHELIALMYLDIDHFKTVNDSLGHNHGDALLKEFSGRLKQCLRSGDIISRFGGDEFVILLQGLTHVTDATNIAKKIIKIMKKKFHLDDRFLQITTSIGIAFFQDQDCTPTQFIHQADTALYMAKNSGRNAFKIANVK